MFRHCLALSVACILCYCCVFSTIVILIITVYPLCVYKVIEQYLLSFSVLVCQINIHVSMETC